MSEPVTRADIREIVARLGRIERRLNDLSIKHEVQAAEFQAFKTYLPGQIDGSVRDLMRTRGKESREMSGWFVSFIVALLTIVVTLSVIGNWIWA